MSCFAVDIYGNVQGGKQDGYEKGGFLKILRREKGLTQEQLAEILLVSGRNDFQPLPGIIINENRKINLPFAM